jgi:multimeric flavodoxin WrbA
MVIKVLAFATSPRRHGNSETLLDWLLAAMGEDESVSIEKYALSELNISPCRGCNSCERINRCVQDDDMTWVLEKIAAADCVILASPVFCLGICAQAKALVDRTQVFRSRKFVLHLPVAPPEKKGKRRGVFISTAGQDWDIVFDGAVMSMKCFFHVSDIHDRDIRYLLIRGVDEKGAVEKHQTAREEAVALGKELTEELKAIAAEGT